MVLLGVLVIVLGFAFKIDTIFIVILSAIVTGVLAGIDFMEILTILGESFINSRNISLFILTLGVIGILERNGLRERAGHVISKIKNITVGGILSLYVVIRTIAAAFSLRIGGHIQFIRPLIYPMAEGAFIKAYGENISEKTSDEIKGLCNSVENYGNFFGQNIFIGASGVLLITGTLTELGVEVLPENIALYSMIIGILAIIISLIQNYIYDMKLKRLYGKKIGKE